MVGSLSLTSRLVLKFHVEGAPTGKPGPTNISVVLCNYRRDVLMMFYKNIGVKDSNEEEVMAILEALRMLVLFFHDKLIVGSESANATAWDSSSHECS